MDNSQRPIIAGVNDPKATSIIAYLTFIGWFVALFLNTPKNEFASFHIRQSLGINLFMLVGGALFIVPVFGWIAGMAAYIMGFLFWMYGFLTAWQEETRPIPFLGEKFQVWFQGL